MFHVASECPTYPSGITRGMGQAEERQICDVQSTGRFSMVLSMGQLAARVKRCWKWEKLWMIMAMVMIMDGDESGEMLKR